MYQTSFTVRYYENYVVGYICQDIVDYYYSLIPKYYYAQRQKHKAHVTISRKNVENPDLSTWKQYDGYRGYLEYSPICNINHIYFWLDCYSTDIRLVRESLGLPQYRGNFTSYHITIANTK